MKKNIPNPSNNFPFALVTKTALSKPQQEKLKGGRDADEDGIIVEDLVEG